MISLLSEDSKTNGCTTDEGIIELSTPNAKLMHRFYEPLQLLSILNADRGAGEVDLPADSQSREARMTCRRFLDDLSWLCDNKHGGETVSAVAAQSLPKGNVIWLVSRFEESCDHLGRVVTELQVIRRNTNEEAVSRTGLAIAKESIMFSRDKVKHYWRFLKIAYSKAREEFSSMIETQAIDFDNYGTQFH